MSELGDLALNPQPLTELLGHPVVLSLVLGCRSRKGSYLEWVASPCSLDSAQRDRLSGGGLLFLVQTQLLLLLLIIKYFCILYFLIGSKYSQIVFNSNTS